MSGPRSTSRGLVTLACLLLPVSGLLWLVGSVEASNAARARPDATPMACAELEAKGPGENAHVALTDFVCGGDYAYEYKHHVMGDEWERVFLPVVARPRGQKIRGLATDVHVVLSARSRWANVHGPEDVERLATSETVEGIVSDYERIDDETRAILAQRYPGVDFRRCWVVEVGKPIATGDFEKAGALGTLAAFVALITAAVIARPATSRRLAAA